MSRLATAERVSREASDNYVFQRSLLAYRAAAERISGDVLEIGTGSGYGIEIIAPEASHFITIDKHLPPEGLTIDANVEFIRSNVPPFPVGDSSVDFVISFQVIEHIKDDVRFINEAWRVLRPGGKLIISTPNAAMSLTRNPWHIREYTAGQFGELLQGRFTDVEAMGVFGNDKIMSYYIKNWLGVERITRFDILRLQYRLPRWLLRIPYDILNRLNRRRLLADNDTLTRSITADDYSIAPVAKDCFDLFYVATKGQ